jgi:hypothetical protein
VPNNTRIVAGPVVTPAAVNGLVRPGSGWAEVVVVVETIHSGPSDPALLRKHAGMVFLFAKRIDSG